MRGRASLERVMIRRKRRFLWLFRRASFYFISLNFRSTFDRKPRDLEQVKGHALACSARSFQRFPAHLHKQALAFSFDRSRPSVHSFISGVFLRMREMGRERRRRRKVRNKYEVCDQCDQVPPVRIEERW